MPFAYYRRLSAGQRRIYERSDAVPAIFLPDPQATRDALDELEAALHSAGRPATEVASRKLIARIVAQFGISKVRVSVLTRRPHNEYGELHGLYVPAFARRRALITVWMRTAKREQVVAFRTFLRTLLHELCHHLDYALLGLGDSFHTEGFYKRESSLLKQLMCDRERAAQRK